MAIKLIDVHDQLKGYSNIIHSKDGGQSQLIDSEVLSPDIDIFRKNVLYLCRASSLNKLDVEKISSCNLIIIKDEEYHLKILRNNDVSIIECHPDISFAELLKSIKSMFVEDYVLLDSSAILLNALIKEKEVKEIAVISSELLYNPIIIIDSAFKVLAYSDEKNIKEEYWIESIKRGYCSYEFIATVKQIGSFQKAPNSNEPFIVICEQSPIRKLVSKILINGNTVAYVLALESEVIFQKNHHEIIKLLSNVLSQKLKKDTLYSNPDEFAYANLMIDILEKNITDEDGLRVSSKDLLITDHLYLLTLKISKYNSSNVRANYLRQFLEQILPRHQSVFFESYVLILLEFKDDFYKDFSHNKEFMEFMEQQNITISVSPQFHNILELPKRYKQCTDTLDLISKLNLKGHLYSYEDLKFYHILHKVDPTVDLLDFCSKKLLAMIDYDEKNSTEYYRL